jgi:hypothetical protein
MLLTQYGASKILKEYDDNKQIKCLSFMVKSNDKLVPIRLPSETEKILEILNEKANQGVIHKRFKNDKEQANRIMWRVILDWIDAQMTMIELGQRSLLQIFFGDICPIGSDQPIYKALLKNVPSYMIEDKR